MMILLVMLLSMPALAVSMHEMSFDELFDEADQIVMASVQGLVTWEDSFVSAEYTLYIEEVYKGNIEKGGMIEANQFLGYGGTFYHQGNVVIAFLSGSPGSERYSVVNGYQGLWVIDKKGYLDEVSSYSDMEELETALMQKGWEPDPNREKHTAYASQLPEETKFPLLTVIIVITAVLAGTGAIVIFRKKKHHSNLS